MSEVRTSQRDSNQEQRLFSFKATQLIWLALGLLEALILLRIGLKIIGANPESLFAAFVYNFSYIFLFPFEGLIGTPSSGSNVLELSSFIAMGVYALLAWAFERVVWLIFYRPRGAVVNVTQQTTTGEPVAVIQAPLREPVAVMQTTTSEQYRE
jgi:hypothetical protein